MSNLPENHIDISGHMGTSPSDDHVHQLNTNARPGTGEASDFQQAKNVPARVIRERVDPSVAAAKRREPLIDVTAITSGSGNSHVAEVPPSRL